MPANQTTLDAGPDDEFASPITVTLPLAFAHESYYPSGAIYYTASIQVGETARGDGIYLDLAGSHFADEQDAQIAAEAVLAMLKATLAV